MNSPPRFQAPTPREVQVTHCLVSLIDDVQVPAREAGALTSVVVVEGQYVSQNQLLAQIDDRQPRLDKLASELERDAALAKAQDDIEVRYSQAAFAVARFRGPLEEPGLAIVGKSKGRKAHVFILNGDPGFEFVADDGSINEVDLLGVCLFNAS